MQKGKAKSQSNPISIFHQPFLLFRSMELNRRIFGVLSASGRRLVEDLLKRCVIFDIIKIFNVILNCLSSRCYYIIHHHYLLVLYSTFLRFCNELLLYVGSQYNSD